MIFEADSEKNIFEAEFENYDVVYRSKGYNKIGKGGPWIFWKFYCWSYGEDFVDVYEGPDGKFLFHIALESHNKNPIGVKQVIEECHDDS